MAAAWSYAPVDSPLTYRGIADDLQRLIAEGQYPPGAAIPSYRELAQIYRASVSKAQRAVDLLRDRRVVIGQQGRGVYVAGSHRD